MSGSGEAAVMQAVHGTTGDRRSIALLCLAGLAMLIVLAGFILLYVNFPEGYDVPYGLSLASIPLFRTLWPYPRLSLEPSVFPVLASLSIVTLWGAYIAASAIVDRCRHVAARKRLLYVIASFAFLYVLILTFAMPPVLSSDIYLYALFGRMATYYGLNPYLVPGRAIEADVVWPFVCWRDVTTHYGPVWTMISAGLAALGDNNVLLTVLVFKGAVAISHLANCLLVLCLARRFTGGDGLGPLLLYAWNPLIVIETAGSGHNEAVMMSLALLGLLLIDRGRLHGGVILLTMSTLVKYLTGILLLFSVIRVVKEEHTTRRRLSALARISAIGVLVTSLAYAPFWSSGHALERLLSVAAPSKTIVRVILVEALGKALALLGLSQPEALVQSCTAYGLHIAFLVFVVLLLRKVAFADTQWSRVLELWAVAALTYVLVIYAWNFPWHLIPALTALFLTKPTRTARRALVWSLGLSIGLMLPYAWVIAVPS